MEEIKREIKLIAVYARVSTARQEEEKTIETQLCAVREFAKSNGFTIVKEYIDEGWSGDILVRPQLDQLRQDARDKLWEAVLAYDPDRLARRYSYQELVMDELRDTGIEVLFVTTPTPKNGEEKILQGVKGLFAEYERAKITERFRLGKLRVAKEGHVLGSDAPYGYRYIPRHEKVHGYYEINEDEAKIVRNIFSWVADDGLTIRKVIKRLKDEDIKPRRSHRGIWKSSTLSILLRNEAYIGESHYLKSFAAVPEHPLKQDKYRKTRKSARRRRPRNEWIKITVPSIINKNLFQRTQERLRKNFDLAKRNRKNEYLLAGKLWCSCGYKLAGEGLRQGTYLYYRCTQRARSFPLATTCFENGINAREADDIVWKKLAELMSSPELLLEHLNRWIQGWGNNSKKLKTDMESVKSEIIKIKDEEERYTKAYGAGILSLDKLSEHVGPLKKKMSILNDRLVKAEVEVNKLESFKLPSENEIRSFAQAVTSKLHNLNFAVKEAIVKRIVGKITVSQNVLHVLGRLPVLNTANITLCSDDKDGSNTTRHENFPMVPTIPFEFRIPIPKLKRGKMVASDNSARDELRIAA
ncbi:MAG TPA: recombinase family protein [Candidatus Acidoferrales bacterium]|nr:recombinase family protein [Candidatus Acidoferrales bacterium]